MNRLLVYDLPTRLFHWIFAGLFLFAFAIAKTVDDESAVFAFHSLAGIVLTFTVVLRVVWGAIGTTHARVTGFALNPRDLISYLKGVIAGDKRRWAGHNPASSWAAVMMLALALGLGVTGFLMSTGGEQDALEDLHEVLANALIIIAALHIGGIVLHSIRHRDLIALSMVDGKKSGVSEKDTIRSAHPGTGILFVILVALLGAQLANSYDGSTRSLRLFGASLKLSEAEETGEHGANDAQDDAGAGEDGNDDGDD